VHVDTDSGDVEHQAYDAQAFHTRCRGQHIGTARAMTRTINEELKTLTRYDTATVILLGEIVGAFGIARIAAAGIPIGCTVGGGGHCAWRSKRLPGLACRSRLGSCFRDTECQCHAHEKQGGSQ
jgi:hypothetical protein